MKRTFQRNDCIHAPHPAMQKALIEYAISKGLRIYNGLKKRVFNGEKLREYVNIYFDSVELCGSSHNKSDKHINWITPAQFYKYCDNWADCQPVEVKLNDSYTAKINAQDKTVTVGCQTFTFDKVLELAEKIKSAQNA